MTQKMGLKCVSIVGIHNLGLTGVRLRVFSLRRRVGTISRIGSSLQSV